MTDIVDRLCDRVDDAVQEITTLRAEVERLRAALRPFAWHAERLVPQIDKICGNGFYKALQDARAALKEDGE